MLLPLHRVVGDRIMCFYPLTTFQTLFLHHIEKQTPNNTFYEKYRQDLANANLVGSVALLDGHFSRFQKAYAGVMYYVRGVIDYVIHGPGVKKRKETKFDICDFQCFFYECSNQAFTRDINRSFREAKNCGFQCTEVFNLNHFVAANIPSSLFLHD